MKKNEQIVDLFQRKQFDGARYACIDRIRADKLDSQAWAYLGHALLNMKRGKMAELCFRRTWLLDPFANWIEGEIANARKVGRSSNDNAVLNLLKVNCRTGVHR